MKTFLRVAAVLVAWGNQYLLTTGGNPVKLIEYGRWPGLQSLLIGAVVGLLTVEVVLRLMRSLLEGGFFARYAAMTVAVFFGGMLDGAIIGFLVGSLYSGSPNLYDIVPGVIERLVAGLILGFISTIMGG